MGLHVLGYRADILGTNCNKLLKLKIHRGGGGGVKGLLQLQYVLVGGRGGGAARRLLLHFTAETRIISAVSFLTIHVAYLTPAELKPTSFESRQNSFCSLVRTRLVFMCVEIECPFSGVRNQILLHFTADTRIMIRCFLFNQRCCLPYPSRIKTNVI